MSCNADCYLCNCDDRWWPWVDPNKPPIPEEYLKRLEESSKSAGKALAEMKEQVIAEFLMEVMGPNNLVPLSWLMPSGV